jgi:hypothetical protein
MLCASCEHRFNSQGENWTLGRLWKSPTDFKLLEPLQAATPYVEDHEYRMYRGRDVAGLDVDQVICFCASLYWRASLHG